jgi:hypothetical protein
MEKNKEINEDKLYPFIVENEEFSKEEITKDLEIFVPK